jgi:hypothetical protein
MQVAKPRNTTLCWTLLFCIISSQIRNICISFIKKKKDFIDLSERGETHQSTLLFAAKPYQGPFGVDIETFKVLQLQVD